MVLETFDSINITRLNVEPAKRFPAEREFDLNKEISFPDWEAMRQKAEFCRKEGSMDKALRLLFHLKILFPERVTELALDQDFKKEASWKDISSDAGWDTILTHDAKLKLLYPNETDDLHTSRNNKRSMEEVTSEHYQQGNLSIAVQLLGLYRILFNGERPALAYNQMIKDVQGTTTLWMKNLNYDSLAELVANARLAMPDKFNELNIKEIWEKVRNNYKEIAHITPDNLAEDAAHMKIIASAEVEIDAQGIHFGATQAPEVASALPEIRNF
jgi:hypothetical protein